MGVSADTVGTGGLEASTLFSLNKTVVEKRDAERTTVPRARSRAMSSKVRFLVSGTKKTMNIIQTRRTTVNTRKVYAPRTD